MEEFDLVHQLSLQELALLKISIVMWEREELRSLALNPRIRWSAMVEEPNWEVVDKVVETLFNTFIVPSGLREKMTEFLSIIGIQIMKWIEFHSNNHKILHNKYIPRKFEWTRLGLMNKRKVAENLVGNVRIPLLNRYRIACIYCLEHEINLLWGKIKSHRMHKSYKKRLSSPEDEPELVIFWTRRMMSVTDIHELGDMPKRSAMDASYEIGLLRSASSGNVFAVDFFLNKLPDDGKYCHIVETAMSLWKPRECEAYRDLHCSRWILQSESADVFCYLVSIMTEEQQLPILKIYTNYSLLCFLEWPYRKIFLQLALKIWNDVEEDILCCILRRVLRVRSVDSVRFFSTLWDRIPLTSKMYDSYYFDSGFWLTLMEREENMKSFLRDASDDSRIRVFTRLGREVCLELACKNKWEVVRLFISECALYADVLDKFKSDCQIELCDHRPKRRRKINSEMLADVLRFVDHLALPERSKKDQSTENRNQEVDNYNKYLSTRHVQERKLFDFMKQLYTTYHPDYLRHFPDRYPF